MALVIALWCVAVLLGTACLGVAVGRTRGAGAIVYGLCGLASLVGLGAALVQLMGGAASPPAVMANRLRPERRKPIAAPSRIACAIASPTRLMRRSIRNTPIGPAPNANASAPTSARRMKANSTKGAMR